MSKILTGDELIDWFYSVGDDLLDFDEESWHCELAKHTKDLILIPNSLDLLIIGCKFYLRFEQFDACQSWLTTYLINLEQNQMTLNESSCDVFQFFKYYCEFKKLIHQKQNHYASDIANHIIKLIEKNYVDYKLYFSSEVANQYVYLLDRVDFDVFKELTEIFYEANLFQQWARLKFMIEQDRLKYTISNYKDSQCENKLYPLLTSMITCFSSYAYYYRKIDDEIGIEALKQKVEFFLMILTKKIDKSALFILELALRLMGENPVIQSFVFAYYNKISLAQWGGFTEYERRSCLLKVERINLLTSYRIEGVTANVVKKAEANFKYLSSITDGTCYSILLQSCFEYKPHSRPQLINKERYFTTLKTIICDMRGTPIVSDLQTMPQYREVLPNKHYLVLMLLNQLYHKTTMNDFKGNAFGLDRETLRHFYRQLIELIDVEGNDSCVVETLCHSILYLSDLNAYQLMSKKLYFGNQEINQGMPFAYLFKLVAKLKIEGLHVYLNDEIPVILTATDGEKICSNFHNKLEWVFNKQYKDFNFKEQLQIDYVCLYLNLSTIECYENFFKTGEGGFSDLNHSGYLEKCRNVFLLASKIYQAFDEYQSNTLYPFTENKYDWQKLASKYQAYNQ